MDIRQAITDKIVAMIKKGGNVARERWMRAAKEGFPRNGKTGDHYRGVNVLILWDAAIEAGFTSNVWLTYKQAESMGAQVRKGEKGVMCAYFDMVKKPGTDDALEVEDEAQGFYFMCKPFWLFNVAQIDGLPDTLHGASDAVSTFLPIEDAEKIMAKSGAMIRHGYDMACYSRSCDCICMPAPERFTCPEAYYATALHELTHWTGHESRLNRVYGKRFGDAAYAFEELVAELGAAFLGAQVGYLDATLEMHASYAENWLAVLENDKTAIFTASRHAGQAFDYLMRRAGTQSGDALPV